MTNDETTSYVMTNEGTVSEGLTTGFKPGVYTVKELALMYFPGSTPRSATTQLRRWVVRNEDLHEALRAAGYRSMQRIYTPRQVMILLYFLGEP